MLSGGKIVNIVILVCIRRSLRLTMYTSFHSIFLFCKVDNEMAIQYGGFIALLLTASFYFCGGDSARLKTLVLLTVYTSP